MSWNIGLATVPSLALGGWMIYDGVRAMYVGDYTTPKSGRYAGQLGPWAGLVQRVGLEPRSTARRRGPLLPGRRLLRTHCVTEDLAC